MMSPRSFLVSRQSPRYTNSPTSSPSTSPPSSSASAAGKDDRTTKNYASVGNSEQSGTTMGGARRKPTGGRAPPPSPSPPSTIANLTRPTTPTSPVQIPVKAKSRDTSHHAQKTHRSRHHGSRSSSRRPGDVHSPDAISPSVAALLAVTSIPPRGGHRTAVHQKAHAAFAASEQEMTIEAIIEQSQECEKELSLSLSKSPLEVLLSPPEELELDDDISISESNLDSILGSALSTRTVSLESMPSLGDSFATDTFLSLDTPYSPPRRRKVQPTRRSLEPVSPPSGGQLVEDPLSRPEVNVEELDFRVFQSPLENPDKVATAGPRMAFRPLKSAFKSNLTASLRALRQAARSFSNINFTSIPPEDFLTRSLLAIDPQVPFTDERRPPPLEEEPTAALRRYLNPTTRFRLEDAGPPSAAAASVSTARTYTASIQMQTYKVHRSRSANSSSGRNSVPAAPTPQPQAGYRLEYPAPGPRQREMRMNPDFIRIAVMEMAMRKRGKLDDQKPGRARMVLPPRRVSGKEYAVGTDGVPERWVAETY